MDSAQAIRTGIAAADNHDVLVFRADEFRIRDRIALAPLVLKRQVLHREIDSVQLASRHGKVSGSRGASGKKNRVEIVFQFTDGNIHTHVRTGPELIPSTHEPSHGAGQMRPVNSGKLLVASRRWSASFQRSR